MQPLWLKNYPLEVESSPGIPQESVAALIREQCRLWAGREAFWSCGRSMTFGEVYDLACRTARWLKMCGVAPGERAAVMLPNVLAFPVVTYGLILAGQIVVTVNPRYTPRELAHQLCDAGARTLFVWEPSIPLLERAVTELDLRLERMVTVSAASLLAPPFTPAPTFRQPAGPAAAAGSGTAMRLPLRLTFECVLEQGAGDEVTLLPADPARPVFLQYTGGTTGIAKGAVLTERNVRAALVQQLAWTTPFLTPADRAPRVLTVLPLYHVAALMAGMFRALANGSSCLLIADARDRDGLVAVMAAQRFTSMSGVNALYKALLAHPRIHGVDFSACAFCFAGAIATQPDVVDRWFALTGRSLVEAYGLTETCCYVSQQALDGRPFNGSVGLALPLTELSIRGARDEELVVGDVGEILVRGPQVMAGYWNQPDETAAAITADGFLRTGDIGAIDAAGYLRLSGRKKDMILVSGFNVYPNEIEAVLQLHPQVLEAAVVGVADEHSGQVPAAFVVRREASLTAAELHAFCATQLTGYKRPRWIEFRDALPKTAVGKVLRRQLRRANSQDASRGP